MRKTIILLLMVFLLIPMASAILYSDPIIRNDREFQLVYREKYVKKPVYNVSYRWVPPDCEYNLTLEQDVCQDGYVQPYINFVRYRYVKEKRLPAIGIFYQGRHMLFKNIQISDQRVYRYSYPMGDRNPTIPCRAYEREKGLCGAII